MSVCFNMKKHIPNSITCLNLFAGCLSIIASMNGQLAMAAYFIFAAAVFDFFDGFAARMLHTHSAIGKELDSLADMVSFGVAPASIMFSLIQQAALSHDLSIEMFHSGWILSLLAFVIAIFSAIRLAKFNLDTRQAESFIGLPTPANALFICSLAFPSEIMWINSLISNLPFLLILTIILSFLLIAELPLFSLKFKSFGWKNNQIRYIFIAISGVILAFFKWQGLSIVILVYVLLSVIQLFNKK